MSAAEPPRAIQPEKQQEQPCAAPTASPYQPTAGVAADTAATAAKPSSTADVAGVTTTSSQECPTGPAPQALGRRHSSVAGTPYMASAERSAATNPLEPVLSFSQRVGSESTLLPLAEIDSLDVEPRPPTAPIPKHSASPAGSPAGFGGSRAGFPRSASFDVSIEASRVQSPSELVPSGDFPTSPPEPAPARRAAPEKKVRFGTTRVVAIPAREAPDAGTGTGAAPPPSRRD